MESKTTQTQAAGSKSIAVSKLKLLAAAEGNCPYLSLRLDVDRLIEVNCGGYITDTELALILANSESNRFRIYANHNELKITFFYNN